MSAQIDKSALLKKIAFWDLIVFTILGIPSFVFLFLSLFYFNLFFNEMNLFEIANWFYKIFWLFLLVINLTYIFAFKDWKRLLFCLGIGVFSAAMFFVALYFALYCLGKTNGGTVECQGKDDLANIFSLLTFTTFPIFHLILALKNYFQKNPTLDKK